MVERLYEEENKKIEIEYINLENFIKKRKYLLKKN